MIGGGPTFVGAVIGGFWISQELNVLILSLAAGAIIYVVKELLHQGKLQGETLLTIFFLVVGFFLGYSTNLLLHIAGGG